MKVSRDDFAQNRGVGATRPLPRDGSAEDWCYPTPTERWEQQNRSGSRDV